MRVFIGELEEELRIKMEEHRKTIRKLKDEHTARETALKVRLKDQEENGGKPPEDVTPYLPWNFTKKKG